nr:hypothetical protein Iba_chr07cCG5860 [Ipomoea batatas]
MRCPLESRRQRYPPKRLEQHLRPPSPPRPGQANIVSRPRPPTTDPRLSGRACWHGPWPPHENRRLGRAAPSKRNKGLISTSDETRENTNGDYLEVVICSRLQKIGRTGTVHDLKVAKNKGLSRSGSIIEGGVRRMSHLFNSGRSGGVGVSLAQERLVSSGQGDSSGTGADNHARRGKACNKGRIQTRVSSLAFPFLSSGRLALMASSEGSMMRFHVGS